MKVCRVVDFFPTEKEIKGDLGPNYYYYSKLSVERGNEEYIICKRKKGQPKEEKLNGIKVIRVSGDVKHPRYDYIYGEFAKKVLSEILKIKPDIVHGHNSLHFGVIRKRQRLKEIECLLITHLHVSLDIHKYADKIPFSFSFTRALKDRLIDISYFHEKKYVTKLADVVIACDNYTKNSVLKYYKSKPIEVVYNGVDLDLFKPVQTNLKDKYGVDYLLLNITRPVPWKGIHYLLKGMKLLEDEGIDAHCLVVGVKRDDYNIYYRWLKSMVEKLDVKNVEFIGRIPYFDLPSYYSAADCFVAPSYPDPSPKTVYEAQACSCPIVATNGGGIPEIFGKESGLLFEHKNVADMVEKIKIVLENPDKFRGGREVIKDRATWNKCVCDMLKVYEKYWSIKER